MKKFALALLFLLLWPLAAFAQSSAGVSISSNVIPNNTTAIVVKPGSGTTLKVQCFNNGVTIAYIKIYDATSATAGTGTPKSRYMCPSSSSGAGFIDADAVGVLYVTGITYVVTTGIADTDTAVPAANTYIVNISYK